MKLKSSPFLTTGLAAFLITPAFALEAPADDAPPPPAAEDQAALPEIKLPAKPKEQAAFLGIVSGKVPEILTDHLGLKEGEGVIVRSLVPNGPAAQAGVAVNDVITKVSGKAIGSPAEISNHIAELKPGEKVSLDLIHKGKPLTLDATLGVRPAELAAAEPKALDALNLQDLPEDLAERVRDAIAGNIGALELGDDAGQALPQVDQAMRDARKQLLGAEKHLQGQLNLNLGGGKIQIQSGATIRMQDPQGSVEVKSKDGAKEITVRDPQGNVTWSGPWDTAQDKAAAPADIQERVKNLNLDGSVVGGGLRILPRLLGAPEAPEE
jgi:serine protease Do